MSYPSRGITEKETRNWLVEKFAEKLNIPVSDVVVDKLFSDFGLDSTETLILIGELEG